MKAYLVENEIEELKGYKHQTLNHSDYNELKKFLEKKGKSIDLSTNKNVNNVYDILFAKHKATLLDTLYYKDYIKANPNNTCFNWEKFIFNNYIDQIDPEGFRIYSIAKSVNLNENREVIENRLKQLKIEGFNLDSFLLNNDNDFDFTPYTLNENDKTEYNGVIDAASKMLDLYTDITKNLSTEDMEVYQNNFFQMFEYTIKNISKNELKPKSNSFRKLLQFIDGKRK